MGVSERSAMIYFVENAFNKFVVDKEKSLLEEIKALFSRDDVLSSEAKPSAR